MDLYAENILDHYRHPRGKQSLADSSVTHKEVNASCGDTLTVSLAITDDHITGIGWDGTGCAISQAAISMLCEELPGKSLEDINHMSPKDLYALLGVPIGPRRVKCALLGLHALKNAVHTLKKEQPQSWTETIDSQP